jgi:hypothetical protein
MDMRRKELDFSIFVADPVKSMQVDSWRLVLGFRDFARVYDIAARTMLVQISPDPIRQFKLGRVSTVNLTGGRVDFFSPFAETCVRFNPWRLFVKFPTATSVAVYDFSPDRTLVEMSSSTPPLGSSFESPLIERGDSTDDMSTLQVEYGEVVKKTELESELNVDWSLDPELD